jgi:hypothetical protein
LNQTSWQSATNFLTNACEDKSVPLWQWRQSNSPIDALQANKQRYSQKKMILTAHVNRDIQIAVLGCIKILQI